MLTDQFAQGGMAFVVRKLRRQVFLHHGPYKVVNSPFMVLITKDQQKVEVFFLFHQEIFCTLL